MKRLNSLFLTCFLSLGLFACSSDEDPIQNGEMNTGEQVYMQFKLKMPTSTKSVTNPDGTTDANANIEEGSKEENTIKNIQIALVNPDDHKVIAVSTPSSLRGANGTYVAPFQQNELVAYAAPDAQKEVDVIIYCNNTTSNTTGQPFNTEETNSKPEDIWNTSTGFWMSNSNQKDMHCINFPSQKELPQYNEASHPFNIGNIHVERTAARFDYAKKASNFILKPKGETDENNAAIKIDLTDMTVFNLSNQCYKLRRVSADGLNPRNIWDGLFGLETDVNYVVDTDADDKTAGGFSQVSADQLQWKKIADLATPDNWNNNMDKPTKDFDYFIFSYVTENTLPQKQKVIEKVATGVGFKGTIQAGAKCAADLKGLIETAEEPLYVYKDVLFGNWARLEKVAKGELTIEGEEVDLVALKAVYNEIQEKIAATPGTPIATVVKGMNIQGMKIFMPTTDSTGKKQYEVYYKYYNKHNDNHDPKVSGPMEYAVVRNNVYKLRVNSISQFGDPNWVDPGDEPIEKDEVFFEVTVEVLPWVVRVNDIDL